MAEPHAFTDLLRETAQLSERLTEHVRSILTTHKAQFPETLERSVYQRMVIDLKAITWLLGSYANEHDQQERAARDEDGFGWLDAAEEPVSRNSLSDDAFLGVIMAEDAEREAEQREREAAGLPPFE